MKGEKIFVVDDDNDILEIVELLLTEQGYEVKVLNHGETIFEDIKAFRPRLLLMDVMLGGMDGRVICKEIKNNPATSSLPVILISGTHDLVKSLNQPGAPDDFLAKPFDFDELYRKIERHVGATS